ncbi:hypothetical protein BSL78_15847 [Apostichopus japonicus]|uniref:Uncharacterized protein n=1 Tax=Stichopus japonicus TaxID=307972 RepID=A0A2G8KH27_STIJA|nr:hypothetical protein BSL78_15847 [Apostichopus japonicus]
MSKIADTSLFDAIFGSLLMPSLALCHLLIPFSCLAGERRIDNEPRSFVTEIHQCVRSGALEKNADIYAVLHILQALKEDKKKLPGLENCLGSVEAQLDALERGFEDEENKRETEDGLDRAWLFESRKLLNSLLGKEPPLKPAVVENSLSTSKESNMSSSLNKSKKKLYNSNSSSLLM